MYSKQKMETIKESAYFDYFKFFSMNAAETIRRLEATFKDEISEDVFFDANHMFRRLRTLLGSYEILLMEIKDSCQFVEIPEFGVCIMKIFLQLISIIKFMAKSMILRSGIEKSPTEKQKRVDQRHTMISTSPNEFYQPKKATSPQAQQRQNFRMKEMASHIFNNIKQEVANLEKQHNNQCMENDKAFEKISKGRQKLQEIQSSQSEAVLSETVNMLFKKSEHINSFINIVQTNLALSKDNNLDIYFRIKEQFEEDCAPKFEYAKQRLSKLFKDHITTYQNSKKSAMVSHECQANIEEEDSPEQRLKSSLHSHKKTFHSTNNQQIRKLKNEAKSLEEQNKSLKHFIQQKCEQYQNMITRLRSEKIAMQCKANSDNKSNMDKSKSPTKKSQSYIENIQNTDNISQSENKQSYAFDAHNPNLNPNPNPKRSKVSISTRQNKPKVKFHFNQTKHLAFFSKVVHETICPQPANKTQAKGDCQKEQQVEKVQKIEKISQEPCFQQIEETPSQQQCSFRDHSAQKSDTSLKQSKFKYKKERTSLIVFPDPKECLYQIDTTFNSKKSLYPLCSVISRKMLKRSQSTDLRQITHDQSATHQYSRPSYHNPDKRLSKFNPSESKVSTFQAMEKDNEKGFSQQAGQSQPPVAGQKKMRLIKLTQGIEMIELCSPIHFDEADLANLFMSESSAANYEILNITLFTKNANYISPLHNKNVIIKEIPNSAHPSKRNSNQNASAKSQIQLSTPFDHALINIIYKYLKFLRQSKKDSNQQNYHIIKNFFRFPHSSVYKRHEPEWKQHEAENNGLELLELKRYISRIMKMHAACKPPDQSHQESVTPSFTQTTNAHHLLCSHWQRFVNKIGLNMIEAN